MVRIVNGQVVRDDEEQRLHDARYQRQNQATAEPSTDAYNGNATAVEGGDDAGAAGGAGGGADGNTTRRRLMQVADETPGGANESECTDADA